MYQLSWLPSGCCLAQRRLYRLPEHMGPALGRFKEMFRASKQNVPTLMELAADYPPGLVDKRTLTAAGVPCLHLLAMYVSQKEHKSFVDWWHPRADLRWLSAAGADMRAASQTYPTPLDVMLLWNGLDWLQWRHNSSQILQLTRDIAAAGCPVDTRLPARGGNGSLQPSTLETWLARLAGQGWPVSQDMADGALAVSRALLECAAAQGSRGRPELLAAAEAVGSPELVAAVQTVLPRDDCLDVMCGAEKVRVRSRGLDEDTSRPSALAAVPRLLPCRPPPAAVTRRTQAAWGAVARRKAWGHVRHTAGKLLLVQLTI